jgi:hypothetical protein
MSENKKNGQPFYDDAEEHQRALIALRKMREIEAEKKPYMTTIVLKNGTIVSSTSEARLMQYVKMRNYARIDFE